VKMSTRLVSAPKSRMVELYLRSPIRLDDVVRDELRPHTSCLVLRSEHELKVRFRVLIAVNTGTVFRDVTPCTLVLV
jgi:hypothetical protein